MNRRFLVLLIVVLLVLLGLVGFYFYLAGGQTDERAEASEGAEGLIHVKTIYTADGENLRRPTGLGAADNGDFYVTLKEDARVIGFDRRGNPKARWGERGIEQGQLLSPLGVAVNRAGNQVFVVDRARLRIVCYNLLGRFQWEKAMLNPVGVAMFGPDPVVATFGTLVRMTPEGETVSETGARGFERGQFDYPRSLTRLGETQDIIVADTNNTRIQRVTIGDEATAAAKWVVGQPPRFQDDPQTKFGVPSGITVDSKDRIIVLDGFRYTITVLDAPSGRVLHTFTDLEGDGPGRFSLPTGIASLGGDYFAVTDTYNDRVQIIRLLLPGEDTPLARRPWLPYLLLLVLPLLVIPFFRRRTYVTREALEAARADESLRLLAGAFKKLYVLPEVAEDFADVIESESRIGSFLMPVDERASSTDTETPSGEDEDERLARAASRSGFARFTSGRRLVIAGDPVQVEHLRSLCDATTRDYGWVREQYQLS